MEFARAGRDSWLEFLQSKQKKEILQVPAGSKAGPCTQQGQDAKSHLGEGFLREFPLGCLAQGAVDAQMGGLGLPPAHPEQPHRHCCSALHSHGDFGILDVGMAPRSSKREL